MHDVEPPAEVIGGPQPDSKAEESKEGPMQKVVVNSSNPETKNPVPEKDCETHLRTPSNSNEAGVRLNINTNIGPLTNEEREEVITPEAQSEEVRTKQPTEDEQIESASSPTEYIQAEANTELVEPQDSAESNPQAMADSIATTFEVAECSMEVSGPVTLWGILQTDQRDSETEDRAEAGEDTAIVSEASGPVKLWRILKSDRQKNLVEERKESQDSPNFPKSDDHEANGRADLAQGANSPGDYFPEETDAEAEQAPANSRHQLTCNNCTPSGGFEALPSRAPFMLQCLRHFYPKPKNSIRSPR